MVLPGAKALDTAREERAWEGWWAAVLPHPTAGSATPPRRTRSDATRNTDGLSAVPSSRPARGRPPRASRRRLASAADPGARALVRVDGLRAGILTAGS